jgi:hypothetical protein
MSEVVQLDSCNETSVTSPDSAHEVITITVEDDDVDTEEQVIPMPISFSPLEIEQDKVSYVSLCSFLDTITEYSVCQLCCVVSMPNNSNVMNENFFLFWVMGICSKEFCN